MCDKQGRQGDTVMCLKVLRRHYLMTDQ